MLRRLIVAVVVLVTFGLITVTDSSAQSGGLRQFYLSRQQVDGAHVFHVCIPGFHFASMWEILNPTTLSYDVEDGVTEADAGSGPPSDAGGWIRTGSIAFTINNCNVWTSNSSSDAGTEVSLPISNSWSEPSTVISPWSRGFVECSLKESVWCVQDEP